MAEQRTHNPLVGGSNPPGATKESGLLRLHSSVCCLRCDNSVTIFLHCMRLKQRDAFPHQWREYSARTSKLTVPHHIPDRASRSSLVFVLDLEHVPPATHFATPVNFDSVRYRLVRTTIEGETVTVSRW
jgi:hypothetical protein